MHVLVTGATGFVGSSLVARLLSRGARVTCLARGSDGADRTRRAVSAAAAGFGFAVDASAITVLPYDFSKVESEHAAQLADLGAVWHCAAHMTFSNRRLREAIDFNVGGTRALVETIGRVAKGSPRFYYVSTAYTGGVEAKEIGEVLHLSPHVVNPYFVSKWCAELVLEKLSRGGRLPISLYRPTIVIGHTQTGWYGGESFGLYNFLDGVVAGAIAGGRAMRIDIAPGTLHNYLPVDDLVYNAIALTELTTNREPFEIFIDQGTDNSNADRVAWIAEGTGLSLSLGRPRTVADHALDLWIAVNKPFNQPAAGLRPFPFASGKLAALLGSEFHHHVLDRETHVRLVRWYMEHRAADVEQRARRRAGVRAARWLQVSGLQHLVPKRAAGGVVAKAVARTKGLI